jgi:hypothetical protein
MFCASGIQLPFAGRDTAGQRELKRSLALVAPIVAQAEANLSADLSLLSADLASLCVFMIGDTQLSYRKVLKQVPPHHPELAAACEAAAAAVDGYVAWIEANKPAMTARVGVGKDNYNWLMRNVYLFPYTWDEIRLIVELEDNRVWTFFRLGLCLIAGCAAVFGCIGACGVYCSPRSTGGQLGIVSRCGRGAERCARVVLGRGEPEQGRACHCPEQLAGMPAETESPARTAIELISCYSRTTRRARARARVRFHRKIESQTVQNCGG